MTETNSRGYVPICECGWYGPAVHVGPGVPGTKHRLALARSLAQSEAVKLHDQHLVDEASRIGAEGDAALDRHAALVNLANERLQRRGRWGSG